MSHMMETTGMMMVSVSVGVGARVLGWTLLWLGPIDPRLLPATAASPALTCLLLLLPSSSQPLLHLRLHLLHLNLHLLSPSAPNLVHCPSSQLFLWHLVNPMLIGKEWHEFPEALKLSEEKYIHAIIIGFRSIYVKWYDLSTNEVYFCDTEENIWLVGRKGWGLTWKGKMIFSILNAPRIWQKKKIYFSFKSVLPLLDAHIITPYFSFLLLPFLESSFFALRPFSFELIITGS